jgi:hypothetical protein
VLLICCLVNLKVYLCYLILPIIKNDQLSRVIGSGRMNEHNAPRTHLECIVSLAIRDGEEMRHYLV